MSELSELIRGLLRIEAELDRQIAERKASIEKAKMMFRDPSKDSVLIVAPNTVDELLRMNGGDNAKANS